MIHPIQHNEIGQIRYQEKKLRERHRLAGPTLDHALTTTIAILECMARGMFRSGW